MGFFIFSLALCIGCGFFVTTSILQIPLRRKNLGETTLFILTGLGVGLGISSLIVFIFSLIYFPRATGFLILDIFVMATFILCGILFTRNNKKPEVTEPDSVQPDVFPIVSTFIFSSFFICLGLGILKSLWGYSALPHGAWDAWAVWNQHARFFFRAGENWKEVFTNTIGWSHPDYPLFLPLLVLKFWSYWGVETTVVPGTLSILFSFSTIFLVTVALSVLRSKGHGYVAGIVFLVTSLYGTSSPPVC